MTSEGLVQEFILIRAAIMLHIFQTEVTCIRYMVTKVVHGNLSDDHSMCNQSHTRLSVLLCYSTSTLPCLEHSETHTYCQTHSHTCTPCQMDALIALFVVVVVTVVFCFGKPVKQSTSQYV